jgi:hypothetical protein
MTKLPDISKRRLLAAKERARTARVRRDICAMMAAELGISYAMTWFVFFEATGERLPFARTQRRAAFEEALALWPNDRRKQAAYVGFGHRPVQFKVSAERYGIAVADARPAANARRRRMKEAA